VNICRLDFMASFSASAAFFESGSGACESGTFAGCAAELCRSNAGAASPSNKPTANKYTINKELLVVGLVVHAKSLTFALAEGKARTPLYGSIDLPEPAAKAESCSCLAPRLQRPAGALTANSPMWRLGT